MPEPRLAVALDFAARGDLLAMARAVGKEADLFKVGLEAFVSHGPDLVREVAALAPVFLDLKLHDIPNTVAGAAAAAARTGAAILNVHASGGTAMMQAAAEAARAEAAKRGTPAPKVVAVTVLTSLDAAALEAVGFLAEPREAALRLALLARSAGLDGVVCSPEEAAAVRSETGEDFLLVVPGVRPAGSAAGDQKRIATPAGAARDGADILVVGRPITQSKDPAAAARAIRVEIAAAR